MNIVARFHFAACLIVAEHMVRIVEKKALARIAQVVKVQVEVEIQEEQT